MEWEEMYDILHECFGVSTETLEIACAIGGCNEETMKRILFYLTGQRSFEDYFEDDEEED
jgi:hypothetical protein